MASLTENLSIRRIRTDTMNNREAELALCHIFCEAFVLGVLEPVSALYSEAEMYSLLVYFADSCSRRGSGSRRQRG